MGLSTRISKAWRLQGQTVMIDVGNDFYVVRFTKKVDYDTTLFGGPWITGEHYLTIQLWYPRFVTEAAGFDKLVAWVCFPNLLLYVYVKHVLARLGN